jgi:hypothetical protein
MITSDLHPDVVDMHLLLASGVGTTKVLLIGRGKTLLSRTWRRERFLTSCGVLIPDLQTPVVCLRTTGERLTLERYTCCVARYRQKSQRTSGTFCVRLLSSFKGSHGVLRLTTSLYICHCSVNLINLHSRLALSCFFHLVHQSSLSRRVRACEPTHWPSQRCWCIRNDCIGSRRITRTLQILKVEMPDSDPGCLCN